MDCHHPFKIIITISILLMSCYGEDTFSKTLTLREQWTNVVVLTYPAGPHHRYSYNISYPVTSTPVHMVFTNEGKCKAGPVVEDGETPSVKEDEKGEDNGTDCKFLKDVKSRMSPDLINTLDESNFWSGCHIKNGRYECHGARNFRSTRPRVIGIGLLRCGEAVEMNFSIVARNGTLVSCSVGDKTGSVSLV